MKKKEWAKALLGGALVMGLVACGEESSGPSEVTKVSSSSDVVESSSSVIKEGSSSSEETQSSSSVAAHVVELLTFENSIYDFDVFVDLSEATQTAVEGSQWDMKIGHSISLNTATTLGLILVEKDFAEVSEADLPTEEEAWVATVAGETVDFATDKIYIVQFPGVYDHATQAYGDPSFKKIQLIYNPVDHSISAKQANLDGSEEMEGPASGMYSIANNEVVDVEPNNWDLVFGAYRTLLASGTEYSVKGGLLNVGAGVEVAIDSVHAFKDISSATGYEFSVEAAALGHDWKSYSSETKTYTVVENRVYIVRTEDAAYKLKFLSFVNGEGIKGYPQFQYQKIVD